jgi:Protein of unknown function (DUF1524)
VLLRERIDAAIEQWPHPRPRGDKAEAILRQIRDRVLGLKLITVELDNEDDAYLVFETLNTRGKELQVSDLVKNHLSRLLKANNKDIDLLKHNWGKVLETFATTQAELDVDSFLHHFWLSRAKEYVTSKKLYAAFKKATLVQNAKSTLDDLVRDSRLYRQVGEPAYGNWRKEEGGVRASLTALASVFRMRQPYPLLLSLMRSYRAGLLSKKNVESTLRVVECFHFNFTAVAQKSSSGGVSFMYASWAQRLHNAKSAAERQKVLAEIRKNLKARLPSEEDFIAGFKALRYSDEFTRQKRLVRYILGRIEDRHPGGVAVDHEKMTIEHVASQRPISGAAAVSAESVAMLGNLLLADERLQQQLANKPFERKREILKKSKIGEAKEIAARTVWGKAEIARRTEELARLAYREVWAL